MKTMKQVTLVVLTPIFALLVFSQFVCAEVFKWIDEKGTVHFTDDPATIPEKYRDSAKGRITEEDLMSPEERIRAKKKDDEEARRRRGKEQAEYEESIREEESRQRNRQLEGATEGRQISGEKEEKARNVGESKKESGPEYVDEACPACGGSGVIWKKTRVLKKDGYFGPSRWEEEKIATKCERCNGKGFTRRRVR